MIGKHLGKIITVLFLLVFCSLISTRAFADVATANSLIQCKWNEVKVDCTENSTAKGCLDYVREIKSHFIIDPGSTQSQYCKNASLGDILTILKDKIVIIIPPLLVTVILEVLVFLLAGFRNKKELISVVIANCISLPSFILSFSFIPLGKGESLILSILIREFLVVMFEICFLIFVAKFQKRLKTILTTSVANFVSASLGSFLLIYFTSILKG